MAQKKLFVQENNLPKCQAHEIKYKCFQKASKQKGKLNSQKKN